LKHGQNCKLDDALGWECDDLSEKHYCEYKNVLYYLR